MELTMVADTVTATVAQSLMIPMVRKATTEDTTLVMADTITTKPTNFQASQNCKTGYGRSTTLTHLSEFEKQNKTIDFP